MVMDGFAAPEDAAIMTQKLFAELPQAWRRMRYDVAHQEVKPVAQLRTKEAMSLKLFSNVT